MNRVPTVLLISAIAVVSAFGQSDAEGSKDYPGITRMPGYSIYGYNESQFDSDRKSVV